METLFTAIGYLLFGKRWILWNMRHGLKTAVFASEMEHDMALKTHRQYAREKAELEAQLRDLENEPEPEIPEDIRDDAKKSYEWKSEQEQNHKARVEDLKMEINNRDLQMSGADGEVGRTRSMVMNNRRKYEFVKGYRLR